MPDRKISQFDTGKIGVYYLKKIWASSQAQKGVAGFSGDNAVPWKYTTAVFNSLGISIESTMSFLYQNSLSFESFENWILENGHVSHGMVENFNSVIDGVSHEKDAVNCSGETAPVLSQENLMHFDQEGYVVVKDTISAEDCDATCQLVYDFLNAKESDPKTWYLDHPKKQGIMVQLFQHELLNRNRLSPKIRGAFQQLWNRSDLLVSMDRVSFNPPETGFYPFPGPNLHWDTSLKQPIPFGLQGLLYLTDTHANQGAFTLIPGMHNTIAEWLESLPEGASPRDEDLTLLNPRPISAKAGDFVIWHQALAHGSSPNLAKFPRIVQYINYQPIDADVLEEWI